MQITFLSPSELAKRFKLQYKTHAQAEAFLQTLVVRLSKLKLIISKYENSEDKDQAQMEKNTQELVDVTEHIDFLNDALNNMKSKKYHQIYTEELLEEKDRQAKLELWMKNNNPNKDNVDLLNFELNKANLEYTQAIAEAFCEWFATGAAGPGTLTFDGKVYTAE